MSGVGAVVDGIGDGVRSGLRFGQQAFSSLADLSLRGARQGIRLTKTVLKQIPVDKLKMSGANLNVMRKMNLRKLFQSRYGAPVSGTNTAGGDDPAIDEEALMDDEADEEALTDARVQERVDKKYFDRDYDPVRFELSQLTAKWNDVSASSDREAEAERTAIEDAILDRRVKCNIVGTTLKRRVLDHHAVFVSGIEHIQKVSDDLGETATACRETKQGIVAARRTYVVGGLMIPHLHRRREHLKQLESVTEAMSVMRQRYQDVTQLMMESQFTEAVTLLRQQTEDTHMERLKNIASMQPLLQDWSRLTSGSSSVLQHINSSVAELLAVPRTFQGLKYRSAMEACFLLGDTEDCFNNVMQCLWNNGITIMTRSLMELSAVKDPSAGIAKIAAGIDGQHLQLAFLQLCGKMAEFLVLYNCICKVHIEVRERAAAATKGSTQTSSIPDPVVTFHTKALEIMKPLGRRIGRDIGEKLSAALESVALDHVDLDKVLHTFFCCSMLVEATSVLNLSKEELASIRSSLKVSLTQFMTQHFVQRRSSDLVAFICEDDWQIQGGPFAILEQRVVMPLTPEAHRSHIKNIKTFTNSDTMTPAANPFFSPSYASPQDHSMTIRIEALRTVTDGDPSKWRPITALGGCVTASSAFVSNLMVEFIARVVVRFPPLAAEVLQWCEEITSLYMYVIAEAFVSCSRDAPIEQQQHFSNEGRQRLAHIHRLAENCAPVAVQRNELSGTMDAVYQIATTVTELGDPNAMYGMQKRCIATDAAMSVVVSLNSAIHSVAALLPQGVVEQRFSNAASLAKCGDEMQQVIMHRMVLATFPVDHFRQDLDKLFNNSARWTHQPSNCMQNMCVVVEKFLNDKPPLPTKRLEDLFLCRVVFAVQTVIVQEYAQLIMNPKLEFAMMNLGKRKLETTFLLQLTVDTQYFNSQMVDMLHTGRNGIALPNFVKDFVSAAYEEDPEKRKEWISRYHAPYAAADLSNWLCASSRTRKKQLDEFLVSLKHSDAIPIFALRDDTG